MLDVKIEDRKFRQTLDRLKTIDRDFKLVTNEFGIYLVNETKRQFIKEVDPYGKPWRALAPSTLLRKSNNFILRDTYQMYNSIYYEASRNSLNMGLKDPKAIYHQTGTSRMPQRKILGISEQRLKHLRKILTLYMGDKFRKLL